MMMKQELGERRNKEGGREGGRRGQ